MSQYLGQPLVYDHRPGAGGAIGSENVARSVPDGYSILIAGAATFYRPLVERDVPFDPSRDFSVVGPIGDGPFALFVRAGLPATLPEFIEYARTNPQRLNFASSGQASTSHLTAEAFNVAAAIQAVHVPYRGAAPAMTDLMAGRIDYIFDAATNMAENARDGRSRVLGVTTAARAPQAPHVPTLAEAGLPGFVAAPWWGIVGPADMPGVAIERLSAALRQALPTVAGPLAEQGCRAFWLDPVAFAQYVQTENSNWTRVIDLAGLRIR
jgi:tripartite-type tricarboxylate transporter receptor subunit TctC